MNSQHRLAVSDHTVAPQFMVTALTQHLQKLSSGLNLRTNINKQDLGHVEGMCVCVCV